MSTQRIIAHCDACGDDLLEGFPVFRTRKPVCYVLMDHADYPEGVKLHTRTGIRMTVDGDTIIVALAPTAEGWGPPRR